MSEYLFRRLNTLQPGEKLTYFVGFLDEERFKNPSGENAKAADIAYRLSQSDRIHLIQERIGAPVVNETGKTDWRYGVGPGFRYIAVGAHPSKRKQILAEFNIFAR